MGIITRDPTHHIAHFRGAAGEEEDGALACLSHSRPLIHALTLFELHGSGRSGGNGGSQRGERDCGEELHLDVK
jgi:hypothetical protein